MIGTAAVALAAATALPGRVAAADAPATPAASTAAEQQQAVELITRALAIVRSSYVSPVSDLTLAKAAISGMAASLDPHSSYLDKAAYDELKVETHGEYGGLGLEVSDRNGIVTVISPIDDTPAATAGLRPGDVISKIDGETASDFTLGELVTRLRGTVGSKVVLTVQRAGQAPFDVSLTRADITVKSVKSQLVGNDVGYVRIASFIDSTDHDLHAAVEGLERQAAAKRPDNKLIGLVLDLRNDPGGLVDQAVAVAGDFLEKGEIVSLRGRNPDDVRRYEAKAGDLAHGVPLVVLINAGSASASEIVAGALQDDRRAVLLGTRSFGKGSVQTIIPLGDDGALRLTTARYYTPSGRSIQGEGITPDIEVAPARIERLNQVAALREADLRGALKNPDQQAATPPAAPPPAATPPTAAAPAPDVPPGATPAAAPTTPTALDAPLLGTADDYQLARAVDLLDGLALFSRGPSAD